MSFMPENLQLANDFAGIANRYVELVTKPAGDATTFARRLLGSLTQLYSGALALPEVTDIDSGVEFRRSTDNEWWAVYDNVGNAFGERVHYWLNYDPIYPRDGSNALVCGSFADDCADIHRDIIGPLMAFNNADTKHLNDIIWEWSSTPFHSHWGIHASQAINALHWIVFDHGIPDASGR